jgi:hypothetical protein
MNTIAQQLGIKIGKQSPLLIMYGGKKRYWEDAAGHWDRREYDDKGNNVYLENSDGVLLDKRIKKVTLAEVEAKFGYKVEVIK